MTSATASVAPARLPLLARGPRPSRGWRWAFGAGVLLLGALGSLLIIDSSWPYVMPDGVHPFMDERPTLRDWPVWRWNLGLHVAGGLVCLPLGLVLLTPAAARSKPLHVVLGRLYGVVFLLAIAPTGLVLGVFAKGGLATAPGFIGSGLFSTWALVVAVQRARQGDVVGHRAFMIRSWAQLASAITFRIAHVVLQLLAAAGLLAVEHSAVEHSAVEHSAVEHSAVYAASLWVSVLGNAALAELYIRRSPPRASGARPIATNLDHQGAPS